MTTQLNFGHRIYRPARLVQAGDGYRLDGSRRGGRQRGFMEGLFKNLSNKV